MRLGAGESLNDILSSSRQVAEGVSTAGQSWRVADVQAVLYVAVQLLYASTKHHRQVL